MHARSVESSLFGGTVCAHHAYGSITLKSAVGPGELLDNLTTTQEPGTLFIELSYKDANPQRAKRIANTVAEVASERISQEGPYDYVVRFRVWEEAPLPANPVSPLPAYRNATLVALGALGHVLGTGLALLWEERAT
jgi:capsular polysaccharide biosynthesis protein